MICLNIGISKKKYLHVQGMKIFLQILKTLIRYGDLKDYQNLAWGPTFSHFMIPMGC